jgi:hypothetical protein
MEAAAVALGPQQAELARELMLVPGSPVTAQSPAVPSAATAYVAGIEQVDVNAPHPPRGNALPRSPQ